MNCWFSDHEIIEIHQNINNEQDGNPVLDTAKINRHIQTKRNEPPTSENRNDTQPNPEQTLTQEQKVNPESLKRIMKGQKNILPSLRNIEWRAIKKEAEKINQDNLIYQRIIQPN